MENIELRWYNGVLQFRKFYDAGAYAGCFPTAYRVENYKWSEWINVPKVNDGDKENEVW